MSEIELLQLFSTNLRELMKEEKITQEDLANEIGIDQSMISRYVNGQSLPSLLTTIKIADVLFCSLDDFIAK